MCFGHSRVLNLSIFNGDFAVDFCSKSLKVPRMISSLELVDLLENGNVQNWIKNDIDIKLNAFCDVFVTELIISHIIY